MVKVLSNHMPKLEAPEELVLVQAKIPKKIHTKVKAALKKNGGSFQKLVEAACDLYLEENK